MEKKLKSIADLMNEISNKKNAPVNALPTESEPLISVMNNEAGQMAAVKLISNAQSKDVARKMFLGTFEGITVESIMNEISQRNRVQ
jgi:hypothetical protein